MVSYHPNNINSNTSSSSSSSSELLLHSPLLMAIQRQQEQQEIVANTVDYKGNLAIRAKHGGWMSAFFIIWVEVAERIAFYGISANLISFLTGKMGQSTAMAAANINAWGGVAQLLPILGAIIADSFVGKYYTIIASALIYISGLGLLTLSAMLPSSRFSLHMQIIIFFVALYLVAVGQGGHKPCVQAFGADQFDGEDLRESKAKSSFFNWWYFGVCFGGLLGIGVMSYVQDNLSWGLGFGIPCVIMLFSLFIFLFGTRTYRYTMKAAEGESPFTRIGSVFVAAFRNRNATLTPMVVYNEDLSQETGIRDGSHQFRFLDKALFSLTTSNKSGKACSESEVAEAKAVLRLFPIWATTLVFAIVFSQPPTFFTKQGITLDRAIGSKFVVPAAALQSLIGICIVIVIPIYDCALIPIARKLTKKPAGISMLQRIGTGLFISILTMVVAAVTEEKRLKTAAKHGLIDTPHATIPMSIWWLLPQYVLFGVSEAFTMVGLQEFFYDQVPNELRSVGLSLYLSIFGLGGLLSSLLVSIINKVTSKGGGESWFPDNLNRAHLDYFYWLLAGLSVIALALFVYFARSYIYNKSKTPL